MTREASRRSGRSSPPAPVLEGEACARAAGRVPASPPWLAEAARVLDGEGEPGLSDPRRRLRLIDAVDRWTPISLGWCGIFVAHCLEEGLGPIDRPRFHHRARPWLDWGEPAEPQLGALLLFWHLHPRSPFGHVGFYWAEDDEAFHVLGGNQRDTIEIQRYPRKRLIGCRWPAGVPRPGLRRRAPPEAAAPFQYDWD